MILFYSSDFVDEHMPKQIDEQKHESKMTCIMHKLIGQLIASLTILMYCMLNNLSLYFTFPLKTNILSKYVRYLLV